MIFLVNLNEAKESSMEIWDMKRGRVNGDIPVAGEKIEAAGRLVVLAVQVH